MKAKYHATGNYLEEQVPPELDPAGHDANAHPDLYEEYKAVRASLRTISCHPSCVGKWSDGQYLTENKDHEVKECRTWIQNHKNGWGCAECCNKDAGCDEDCDAAYYRPNCPFCKGMGWFKEPPLFAFPLPVKSEDDLWRQILDTAMEHLSDGERAAMNYDSAIAVLKQKYTLTKK